MRERCISADSEGLGATAIGAVGRPRCAAWVGKVCRWHVRSTLCAHAEALMSVAGTMASGAAHRAESGSQTGRSQGTAPTVGQLPSENGTCVPQRCCQRSTVCAWARSPVDTLPATAVLHASRQDQERARRTSQWTHAECMSRQIRTWHGSSRPQTVRRKAFKQDPMAQRSR